jgi:predicted TIM-barrel fold metal-dependent hydrolase
MYIDMRLRPPLPTWVGKANFAKGIFYPVRIGFDRPPSAEARSMELLLREMDEANIEYGVIMGRQSIEPLGVIPNDEIAKCVSEHTGRFLGWGGIDLAQSMDACLAEIRRCVKDLGFKGVSIEPSIARDESYALADDPRLYPIYEECVRLDVPVNISLSAVLQSTVNRPYELSNPIQIYKVAKDFPKLDIHVAHAAWPYVMEMIGVCFVCPNVWLSPDQYMIKMVPAAQEYVKAANHYFSDRTLFGTSYPSKPLDAMVRAYSEWDWAPGLREKVLHANARRLMRIG